MKQRTYLEDTIAIALLYRKEYVGSEMLSYEKAIEFDRIINKNLESMNFSCKIYGYYDNSDLFVKMTDENGKVYYVISPEANIEDAWHKYIGCLPIEILVAAQMPNALEVINLELVNGKLKNKLRDNKIEKSIDNCNLGTVKIKKK